MTIDSSTNKEDAHTDVAPMLHSWVDAQMTFWEKSDIPRPNPTDYFQRLSDSKSDVFIFVIRDQKATIQPKPRHYTPEQLERGGNEFIKRAHIYRQFFSDVTREYCPQLECQLAMSMDDMALESSTMPLFSFQKRRGSHAVLLPDIDSLIHKFYAGGFEDRVLYEQKLDKAIFIGSTTGAVHTQKSVRELTNERLKLGLYFRDNPDVVFNLPNVTQADSPETEQAIRDLGFGTGGMNWHQQLDYKFLISVDGNGATCSRVVISLKSHSVLLKFNSDHVLYYFDGLEPHRHYLPISDPADVQAIVDAERHSPGLYRPIAEAGTAFYRRYLTRVPSMTYTALLLERYARLFPQSAAQSPAVNGASAAAAGNAPPDIAPGRSDVRARCIAHIRDRGDVAFDLDSWIGDIDGQAALEGFQIAFQSGIETGSLNCKIFTNKGDSWEQQPNDSFVGSRSRSNPIIGLAFDLKGDAAGKYDCVYVCAFADGTLSPRYANGEQCLSDDTRPIKAFQIAFPFKPSHAA